ncbi:MAG: D-alanine--D-alanine ligase [Gemmatimonadetes bacterium]|jgi:D-alanine-D-alanine ligase|nr:D-alanine--D-alanine ligase [Gemmatimonadota bacterium]
MKIAVLMGGVSAEREVSLSSGLAITAALRERGHEVYAVDTARGFIAPEHEKELLPEGVHAAPPDPIHARLSPTVIPGLEQVRGADISFLALHGGIGEDGTIQALFELSGLPYTGSGPLGSAIAMDKDVSKRLLRDAEIPTLPWRVVRAPEYRYDRETIEELVGLPCIVKPSRQGSSVGLRIVHDAGELENAIQQASEFDTEVMIEKYVKGRELTVGILDGQALPPVEIRPKKGIYDYESKYTAGMTEYLCPAPIDGELTAEVQAFALRAFKVLKLRGYARIDFILAQEQLFCLEANTLPGMTATSLLPKGAAAAGITFPDLCERIAAR